MALTENPSHEQYLLLKQYFQLPVKENKSSQHAGTLIARLLKFVQGWRKAHDGSLSLSQTNTKSKLSFLTGCQDVKFLYKVVSETFVPAAHFIVNLRPLILPFPFKYQVPIQLQNAWKLIKIFEHAAQKFSTETYCNTKTTIFLVSLKERTQSLQYKLTRSAKLPLWVCRIQHKMIYSMLWLLCAVL